MPHQPDTLFEQPDCPTPHKPEGEYAAQEISAIGQPGVDPAAIASAESGQGNESILSSLPDVGHATATAPQVTALPHAQNGSNGSGKRADHLLNGKVPGVELSARHSAQTVRRTIGVGAIVVTLFVLFGAIKSCTSEDGEIRNTSATAVEANAGGTEKNSDNTRNSDAPPASVSDNSGKSDGDAGSLSADTAVSFVQDYVSKTASDSGMSAQSLVEIFYADRINYFGQETDRSVVELEKVKYERRWPQRNYTIEDGSLSTNCVPDAKTCFVSGIMAYDAISPERGAHGSGRASFEFGIELSTNGLKIVSENSNVIH